MLSNILLCVFTANQTVKKVRHVQIGTPSQERRDAGTQCTLIGGELSRLAHVEDLHNGDDHDDDMSDMRSQAGSDCTWTPSVELR